MTLARRLLRGTALFFALMAWGMSGVGASLADAARAADAAPSVAHAESRDASGAHSSHEHDTCGLCQLLLTPAHAAVVARVPAMVAAQTRTGRDASGQLRGLFRAAAAARAPPATIA